MKKSVVVWLAVILVSISAACYSSKCRTVDVESTTWRVEILKENPRYTECYSVGECDIYVLKSGNGLDIFVRDYYAYDKILTQEIFIRQNRCLCNYYFVLTNSGNYLNTKIWSRLSVGFRKLSNDKRDIFQERYRDLAKGLPLHVKEKFFGYYIKP